MTPSQQVHVADVARLLEAWAPPDTAESWDNVGLVVGDPRRPVRRVLVTMDVDAEAVADAEAAAADLIVAHHPPIFRPLRALRSDEPGTALLFRLIQAGIAVYAAHTNLDRAAGGVNDVLAAALDLVDVTPLQPGAPAAGAPASLPRIGELAQPLPLTAFAGQVKERLGAPFVLVAGPAELLCRRVAVCGGSGGSFLPEVLAAGADAYVTGDLRYHEVRDALAHGLALVDPGHYASERPVLEVVARRLREALAAHGVAVQVAPSAGRFRTPWRVL